MKITIDLNSVTDIAAWVGAATGILALVFQIFTWRRATHNVKVKRAISFHTYGDEISDPIVSITAHNKGTAAVDIAEWAIRLGRKGVDLRDIEQRYQIAKLPHRLEAGASVSFYMPRQFVDQSRHDHNIEYSVMRCWVRLATGQRIFAKRGVGLK